jgi:hypothetical protein
MRPGAPGRSSWAAFGSPPWTRFELWERKLVWGRTDERPCAFRVFRLGPPRSAKASTICWDGGRPRARPGTHASAMYSECMHGQPCRYQLNEHEAGVPLPGRTTARGSSSPHGPELNVTFQSEPSRARHGSEAAHVRTVLILGMSEPEAAQRRARIWIARIMLLWGVISRDDVRDR